MQTFLRIIWLIVLRKYIPTLFRCVLNIPRFQQKGLLYLNTCCMLMGIKACCHFHLTTKLDVYHSLSCLLPIFLSLAGGPQRITQERPVGHSSQTALLLQSTASESETWLNLATHLLTAFSGFMIKMFSPDEWGRVTFPAVSLLMLLIHFTWRLISNVTMNEGKKAQTST